MASTATAVSRKAPFLGAKIRMLRKRGGLTLKDLSLRCAQLDADSAPSVSYLSLIETGRRTPSEPLLRSLAEVFQRDPRWFADEQFEPGPLPSPPSTGGVRMALEPGFLFSKDLLEAVIPELLSQTGTDGRQFAHLLIRSWQEHHRNQFPDLERAAEDVGKKVFPIDVEGLRKLCRKHGLRIRWFDRTPFVATDDSGRQVKTLVRSFYDAPRTVYINERLRDQPARLKYELAVQLGHKVLHDGDGLKSSHASGSELGGAPHPTHSPATAIGPQDIQLAWRDFECSFFAGALLCPRLPFRQFLMQEAHDPFAGSKIDLTPAVIMRRMTAVSSYRHWHFFDAYPPGILRAVYRANGIPLPWGNLRLVTDPCPQWAVFRMLDRRDQKKPFPQISVLHDGSQTNLYACMSLRTRDAAGNPHVLSVGIDLAPALESQGTDAGAVASVMLNACLANGGSADVPDDAASAIRAVSQVLNIAWVGDGLNWPAAIICPRSTACPRPQACERSHGLARKPSLNEITEQIIRETKAG